MRGHPLVSNLALWVLSLSKGGGKKTATKNISTEKETQDSATQCDYNQASTSGIGTEDPQNEKCIICLTRPKSASIIHGYLGHQVCCCKCARKLKRLGKPCPICRRPIQH